MSHSLATSSLLKAVGVHPDAAGAAGATAAVKWITKDGIGAMGRLLVSLQHYDASAGKANQVAMPAPRVPRRLSSGSPKMESARSGAC